MATSIPDTTVIGMCPLCSDRCTGNCDDPEELDDQALAAVTLILDDLVSSGRGDVVIASQQRDLCLLELRRRGLIESWSFRRVVH